MHRDGARGRLRWLALYPTLCLAWVGAHVAWAAAGGPAERPGRGLGAGWFSVLAVATLPTYGLAAVALSSRVRRLGPRGARVAAALAAVLTPVLGAAVLAVPSRVHVGYPGLADALAYAGPWVAGAAGLPLGYLLARGLAARRAA